MKKEEFTGKMKEKLNFTFNLVDSLRREGLEDLMAIRLARQSALKKEKKRLTKKLGAGHPRIKELEKKIHYTDGVKKNLDVLIIEAKTKAEPVDSEAWKIHGKVTDKHNKGMKNLSVGLFDKEGKWQRELGFGKTDNNGYFSIVYAPAGEDEGKISTEMELFLYISDKEQKVLHKGSEPLFYSPGEIEYVAVTVSEDGDVYVPPRPGPVEPVPVEPVPVEPVSPSRNWVVKGRVTDSEGKSLSGHTVSLYDKDSRFDERLGTTLTDEDGSFTFTFEEEGFRDLIEANPDIFVEVRDEGGETKYASRKPLKFAAGKVDKLRIRVSR